MKNQAYWSNRQKQLNSQLEKDEEKLRQKLSAEYDKQSKRLEKEIASYYQLYGANDAIEYRTLLLSLSDADRQLLMERMDEFAQKYPQYAHLMPVRESIYKLDRLEGLQMSIRMQQLEIGAIDNIQLEQHLSEYAAKSANVAAEQLGLGKNFYNINSDVVKMTINKKWINDKNFSERIWDNRKKLADYLCNDFASAVVRGDSYQKCINALKDRFDNVSRNDMFRLIYTEDTYVTNEASAQTFEEYYEQYQFHTVDGNACKTCKGINEKIFYFKDRKPGLNFPPLHAWCRCYYTVEVDDWDKWMDDYVDKKQAENVLNLADTDFEVRPGKNSSAKANFTIIDSPNYVDKFSDIGLSESVQSKIADLSTGIISRRDGTSIEEVFAVDKSTGKILSYVKGTDKFGVNMSEKFKNVLKSSKKGSIMIVHNHPLDFTFSLGDIHTFSQYPSIGTVVAATHTGKVHYAVGEIKDFEQITRDYRIAYTKYFSRLNFGDAEAREKAWVDTFGKAGVKYGSK